MSKRTVSGITLTLLFIGMLMLAFDIQPAEASGTIYIRADGSVDPDTAPISTVDNVTYTFTDNIYDEIVVERDNIVVDGTGYTLQGAGSGKGIDLSDRSNVTIKNTEIKSFESGIWLRPSNNITINQNIISDNKDGVYLYESSSNSIIQNNITNNTVHGILAYWSSNNTVELNNLTNNEFGISLYKSSYHTFRDNNMAQNQFGFSVIGGPLVYFIHDMDTSNTVNGKPVYYWINRHNAEVPSDAGFVALINCTQITVRNLNFTMNFPGITVAYTVDSSITQNFIANTGTGVYLHESSNNTVSQNNITNNKYNGIYQVYSSSNTVKQNNLTNNGDGVDSYNSSYNVFYHNNFINNINHVGSFVKSFTNTWDNGYPSGGNYWSDYTGVDVKSGSNQDQSSSDGIGDTPYVIDENNTDKFPLMQPYHGPVRNLNSGESYPTIQEGIDNATENDGILVLSGTYYENVVVNKNDLTLLGQNRSNTVIDGKGTGTVIKISASRVTVKEFTIRNSAVHQSGIYIGYSYTANVVRGNTITSNYVGISILSSNNITVTDNNITNNQYGFYVVESSDNDIVCNIVTNNLRGIWLDWSNFNNITSNTITKNSMFGIGLYRSSDNTIIRNTLINNSIGITLLGFAGGGIFSDDNIIHHNNFINNTQQVSSSNCTNIWDNGCEGNYWSDYEERYPDATEIDYSGIWDTPYVIDANNQDRYPLMNPWGTGTPVASFTWTPSIPKVDELVTFDASSSTPNGGEIVSYEWNFGDDNYGSGKTVTHTYTSSGVYTVTLNVSDSEGLSDIEQKQMQVVQPHGPKADFTATPDTALTGESIKFDASASLPGWNGTHEMPITAYRWDFGDGNQTTTSNPIVYHSFSSSGNYYVTLTVYAPEATPETDSTVVRVTITAIPVGGYSFPINPYTTEKPLAFYLALVAILTTVSTAIKRKTHRRTKR